MFKTKSILIYSIVLILFYSCSNAEQNKNIVKEITSEKEFNQIIEKEKDKLLGFDLYADWCAPCRILSPMLERIAAENRDKINIYKINVDKLSGLAQAFGVTGIPYVVFVKNKTAVHALTGVQGEDTYQRVIDYFNEDKKEAQKDKPSGKIVKGTRIVNLHKELSKLNIYVYRGETVKLVFEPRKYTHSVHIPEYKISKEIKKDEKAEVTFKAKNIGVFPIYCNGDCPQGDGAQAGQIVVMQYKVEKEASFKIISAKEAKKMLDEKKTFLLDVRSPREYYDGHISGAKLIPLQQLEDRISELDEYKDKDIIVYCRSGNRSIVSVEILIKNGFKKLFHIKRGIIEWKNEGYKINKTL